MCVCLCERARSSEFSGHFSDVRSGDFIAESDIGVGGARVMKLAVVRPT